MVRVVITIFLARILEPSDFGLIAILNIFIALSDSIIHGGFTTSLIRKPEVTRDDFSTVFIFNIVVSALLYVLIFFLAPHISTFFNEPQLLNLSKFIALAIVFHSFGIIQNVILRRRIDFKKLAIVNIVSTISSGVLGIVMALKGYGVWSLAIQIVSKAVFSSLFLWIIGNWKLSFRFSKFAFLDNFNFGYKISVSNIVTVGIQNLYNMVIGKLYDAGSLGIFHQAEKLSTLPPSIIGNIFKSVSLPVLASLQGNTLRLNNGYLKFLRMVGFISFPLMIFLIIIAKPLFVLLLTDKWIDSVILFQILCVKGIVFPLITISGNMPLVIGRSDVYLKYSVFYSVLTIIAIIVTSPFGIKVMVVGIVVQSFIQLTVNMFLISHLLNLSLSRQLMQLKNLIVISLVAIVPAIAIRLLFDSNLILIAAQSLSFLSAYLLIQKITNSEELLELEALIKENFVKLRNEYK